MDNLEGSFEATLNIVKHEMVHILGFEHNAMSLWIDPTTGLAYGEGLPQIKKTIY